MYDLLQNIVIILLAALAVVQELRIRDLKGKLK